MTYIIKDEEMQSHLAGAVEINDGTDTLRRVMQYAFSKLTFKEFSVHNMKET